MPVKLHFVDDERQTRRKETKFTDFDEEIKLLRNSISRNGNSEEVDSIYKKLEELLWGEVSEKNTKFIKWFEIWIFLFGWLVREINGNGEWAFRVSIFRVSLKIL